jgi:phage terminase small subunit
MTDPADPSPNNDDAAGDGLTAKQRAFVSEYLVDMNATQAAIRAGYSAASAGQIGDVLLKKAEILAAVRSAEKQRLERVGLAADDIVRELHRIARADLRRIFTAGGSLMPPAEWDDDTAAAIQSVKVTTRGIGQGEVEHVAEVKLWPKGPALEALAKRAWPERKGRPVRFEMPPIKTPGDVVAALASVAQAVSVGDLTPDEAAAIAGVLEVQRRAVETVELEARIAALEGQETSP